MIDPAPTRRTTARTRRRAAVLTGVLATSLLPIAFGGSTTAGAAGATSKFVSIAPKRVVDSRDSIDLNRAAPLTANVPTDITLAGIGIPGQANVVPATATAGSGYVIRVTSLSDSTKTADSSSFTIAAS